MWTIIQPVIKTKLFWIVVGILVLILILWQIGAVNAGLDMAKKLLASKEVEIANQLKIKLEATEKKAKENETKAKNLGTRVLSKEKELTKVRTELTEIKGRLKDAEKRFADIIIPGSIDDRVKRLRELGLKSAVVTPRPK